MNYTRNKQIPKVSGGSFTPKGATAPKKYVFKEKLGEMLRYALPQIDGFPPRYHTVASYLRRSLFNLERLAVTLDLSEEPESVAKAIETEFAILKDFIVLASDRDYYKFSPPLSLHERETWGKFNVDIELLIEGLKKA